MMIHEVTEQAGRARSRRRVGRGDSSGQGKTCGRGHKGAASRSGWTRKPGYEGGQMPLIRRIPKRGFSNARFRRLFHAVNVGALEGRFKKGAEVHAKALADAGLIRDARRPLKILGNGELKTALVVVAAKFSRSARAKIESAGGTVVEQPPKTWSRPASGNDAKAR